MPHSYPLYGLVLAGGHSQRMGQPKALLDYHGRPQYRHAAALLEPFCAEVYLSCRAEQAALLSGYPLLLDTVAYGEIGPYNALLTAFARAEPPAWFVLGCDYPLVRVEDLAQLVRHRREGCIATAFENPEGFLEPLIAVYEPAAGPLLLRWWEAGNASLRRFLDAHSVCRVQPDNAGCLQSVDTEEAYLRLKQTLKK